MADPVTLGLGIGASVLSGIFGRRSAKKASRAFNDSLQANQKQYDAFDGAIQGFLSRTQKRYGGYQQQTRDLGDEAYQNLMNLQQGNLGSVPGYNFGLNEGTRAINRANATRGIHGSSAHAQALNNYAQNYANTQFNQHYNRNIGLFDRSRQAESDLLSRLQGADTQALYLQQALLNARTGNTMAQGQQRADAIIGKQSALDQAIGNIIGFSALGFGGGSAVPASNPIDPSQVRIPSFNINGIG